MVSTADAMAAVQSSCTIPDMTGKTVCTLGAGTSGTFRFPSTAKAFTLLSMSSGNGGVFWGYVDNSQPGGYGAQIASAITFAIPSNYALPYWIGLNAEDLVSAQTQLVSSFSLSSAIEFTDTDVHSIVGSTPRW